MRCSTCKGAGLLDHGLCDYPCEDCSGTGDSSKKKQPVKPVIILDESALAVINLCANTAVNIVNMSDDKHINEMAAHIADQLISLTNPEDF